LAEHQLDAEVGSVRESKAIEVVFKALWDRVKKAGEMIESLREERRNLQARVSALEEQVTRLTAELKGKEEDLRKLSDLEAKQVSQQNNTAFTVEEKEALKSRIKELLLRINSHL